MQIRTRKQRSQRSQRSPKSLPRATRHSRRRAVSKPTPASLTWSPGSRSTTGK